MCKSRLENIEFLYMIDEENTDLQATRQEKKQLIRRHKAGHHVRDRILRPGDIRREMIKISL